MKNKFLNEMQSRGYLNQCTNIEKLGEICDKKSKYNRKRDMLARHKCELKKIIEAHIGPEPESF